jgi:hypothetical protein
MEYTTTLLWLLGLAFLTLAWLGIAVSVFVMGRGFFGRMVARESALPSASAENRLDIWRHGLIAGAIGYVVVVVLYVILNLAESRNAFFTPDALGRSLLGAPLQGEGLAVGPLLVYNGLHLVVFLALGLAAAWVLWESGRHPKVWYLGLVLLLAVFFHLVGVVVMLAAPSEGAVPAWSVVAASAAAALTMGFYLVASEPRILQVIRMADLEG